MACYDVWLGDGAADKMTGGGTGQNDRRWNLSTRMDKIRNEYIRGAAQVE